MSDFKVFYSWQSDLPNATNRGFIGDALEKACKEVDKNPEVEESPRVDQDTQGLPGAPSIPQAIMDKIDACQVFVADVSFCYEAKDGTQSPNPNVAYELGYAVARLSWDRIILVMNTEFGRIESLPFDLEKRRATGYLAKEGEKDRSDAKRALVKSLTLGIEAIAKRQPIVTRVTPTEAARDAITSQSPDRILRIREFQKWLLDSLDEKNPGDVEPQEWIDALTGSIPIVEAFSLVTEAAAIVDDTNSIKEIWRGFENILEKYDLPRGFSGSYTEEQFDWWRFHGYEMCVIFSAHLLREQKLELIGQFLRETFVQRRWAETRGDSLADYQSMGDWVRKIYRWNQTLKSTGAQSWISPLGEVFKARYVSTGEQMPNWTTFCEADLLLALFGLSGAAPDKYGRWLNHTYIYLDPSVDFLIKARQGSNAMRLMKVFGQSDLLALKKWLAESAEELKKGWQNYGRFSGPKKEIIDSIGTL